MGDVSKAIDRYPQHLAVLAGEVERLEHEQFSHEQAEALVYDAVTQEIIPL